MIIFGPVPSRRFGRSLGINNIPPKICSYSCIYCQIGVTSSMDVERKKFYSPERIYEEVRERVDILKRNGEKIDFLTFVPDGEPTLDLNLGREIEMLRQMGIKIAVITNSSLLWREDVRREIGCADVVSVKVDAVSEKIWRRMNRPHFSLSLSEILKGIQNLAEDGNTTLITETMLVNGVNDDAKEMERVAEFIASLSPHKAYIAIPTRPPAESWVSPSNEEVLNRAYQIFAERVGEVEYLIGYEGNEFAFTDNVEENLLSITSVHPMREDAVREFLKKANADWSVVEKMIERGDLLETHYRGKKFYVRRMKRVDGR